MFLIFKIYFLAHLPTAQSFIDTLLIGVVLSAPSYLFVYAWSVINPNVKTTTIERRILMTALSNLILESYQIRKTNKQKTAFIQLMQQHYPEMTVQECNFPKCRNLIIGDIDTAQVVLTAHYDTCARLLFPNFIAPKNPLLSILYSLVIVIPLFIAVFLSSFLLSVFSAPMQIHYLASLIIYIGFMVLLLAGPPNKHTANDNTSGVITLCELLGTLDQTQRNKVAFVFFDHEETGLIGSSFFRSKYKQEMANKLLINFDCVSDGDYFLICASKAARAQYGDLLKQSFTPSEDKSILFSNLESTYYPSDQAGFKMGVAVAALKHKRFLGYYMDRIHTSADTVFERKNIAFLCNGVLRLLKSL